MLRVEPRRSYPLSPVAHRDRCSAPRSRSAISIARRCRSPSRPFSATSRSATRSSRSCRRPFSLAYAFMYAGGGALVDALGTRRGLLVIMIAMVARVGQPRVRDRLPLAAREPVSPRHGRRRRLSGGDQGGRGVVSRARAIDGDGDHQRGHRGRRRRGAAGDRGDSRRRELAMGLRRDRAIGLVWTIWWMRAYQPASRHPRTVAGRARGHRRGARRGAGRRTEGRPGAPAVVSRGLGTRRREVPERRRLVFLSVLAAEVSLRRARLRRETGRRLRVDSVRRGRRRLPRRRLVLELAAAAGTGR